MKRPNRHIKSQGFQMSDREPTKQRQCQHGFIPAEQYLRETGLTVPLQIGAIQHSLDTPAWRRQYSLDETMIALLTLLKNRPAPMLKRRQTMDTVPVEAI
ncbi:MAG TPA: hypothetical protein VIJ25_05500 [Methylococcales bacterium]